MMLAAARRSWDLVALVALALLGLAMVLAQIGGPVAVAVLMPLAFAVPGYAVTAALFPPRAIPAAERLVYAVALGIAVSALSGVIAQLVFSLDRTAWALLLFLLTLAASWLALRRRDGTEEGWRPRIAAPGLEPLSVALIVTAIAIAAWATTIATDRAHDELSDAHFTELWVKPGQESGANRRRSRLVIGVANHRGHPTSYRIRLTQGDVLLRGWSIRLGEGRHWTADLSTPRPTDSKPLEVSLLRGGTVYRRVFLRSDLAS